MRYTRLVVSVLAWRLLAAANFQRNWPLPQPQSSADTQLAEKVCRVAAKSEAYVNFLYIDASAADEVHLLERQLMKCMCQMPTYLHGIRDLRTEPNRNYSSFSVFVVPGASKTAALARLRNITASLNGKQRLKHLHNYAFVWRGAVGPQLRQLFELVWSKGILNAVALTHPQRTYTFEPFSEQGFRVKLVLDERHFYDKLQNLHRQQLRITMFTDFLRAVPRSNTSVNGYRAVDGLLASTIMERLNATASYKTPADREKYGTCLPNGSFSGVLRDLVVGSADVNFNARFVLRCVEPHVEQVYPYHKRVLYLVVPAAELLPEYLIFVNVFSTVVWRLLVLHFLIVVAVFWALQRLVERLPQSHKMRHGRWYELLELFLKTQLGEPVEGFSGISSLRQFLIGWILFSYVVTSVYFAKLESSFVHPAYESNIDALDELQRLQVPIYGVHTLFTAVQHALAPQHAAMINERAVQLPLSFSSRSYGVAISQRRGGRVAFIMRDDTAKDFVVNTFDVQEKRPTFHVVKEYLRALLQTYLLPLGSPYLYKIQHWHARILEAGLLDYWTYMDLRLRSDTSYDDLLKDLDFDTTEHVNGNSQRTKKVALSMDILQGAFYMWLFGVVLSLLGFLAEYVYWWYKRPESLALKTGSVI